jgi:hypothetical protein
MDGLLILGFILQVFYFTLFVIYIRNRRAKKRFKEELETEELYGISAITGTTYRGWGEYDNRDSFIPYRKKKEDFIPKKKMKYHTLEEPIEYYSDDEAEESGPATVCDDCGFTTDYEYPF